MNNGLTVFKLPTPLQNFGKKTKLLELTPLKVYSP